MNHLVLDTCTWLYLANGHYPLEKLHKLDLAVRDGSIKIVLPETVFREWDKNKLSIERNATRIWTERLDQPFAQAKKLAEYFDDPDKASFQALINKIPDFKKLRIQEANNAIKIIEDIFEYRSTIKLPTSDEHRLKAVQHAIEKLAPFGEKNSICDALILFSICEFRNEQLFFLDNCFFITDNYTDFSSKEDRQIVHPHLTELFESYGIKYFYQLTDEVYHFHFVYPKPKRVQEPRPIPETDPTPEPEDIDEYDYPEEGESISCLICNGSAYADDNVPLSEPFEVENETVVKIDPNQLWINFIEDNNVTKIPRGDDTLQDGVCSSCNTVHIKCGRCDEINALEDIGNGIVFMCEGDCGLLYQAKRDKESRKIIYKILKENYTFEDWEREYEQEVEQDSEDILKFK